MLELRNVSKIYQTKTRRVAALDGVSFVLPEKGFVFILGRSGSGKTTMLNMLGGLDVPTEGELLVDGVSSRDFKQVDFDNYRNRYAGFVFQEYHLLDDYTVADNIALALELQGDLTPEERQQKIAAALEQVDLAGYGDRNTGELSGGQKQRVAIARALVKDPPMLLADEPTGALDRKTGRQLFDLLKTISKDKLVVVVSHDEDFAHEYADRILELEEGKIISDSGSGNVLSETAKNVFPPKKTLSIKNALKRSMTSMGRKKLRLAFTAVLCAISFLLVSAADLLSAYEYRTVLTSSLYDQRPGYITLSKEVYNDYDYSKPGLMLPTQETVDWFKGSGIKTIGGTPSWQSEYMFTEEDLATLQERTGVAFKGVYRPELLSFNIEANYWKDGIYDYVDAYADTLSGMVEFTEEDLETFGYTMVAGRLPQGNTDEVAISKYLYQCFEQVDYEDWAGFYVSITYRNKDTNKQLKFERLTWNEYLDSDYCKVERHKTAEELERDWGCPVSLEIQTVYPGTNVSDITSPEDLIGKQLYFAQRAYTITGIIDTGFDKALYDPAYYREATGDKDESLSALLQVDEMLLEYQRGIACLAFVGEGRIAAVAEGMPTVVFTDSLDLRLEGSDRTIEITGFVRASEMEGTFEESRDWDGFIMTNEDEEFTVPMHVTDQQIYISKVHSIYNKYNQTTLESFTADTVEAVGRQGRANYSGMELKLGIFEPTRRNNWLEGIQTMPRNGLGITIDEMPTEMWSTNKYQTEIPVYAIVTDEMFDLFTEGRAGKYAYAIGALPQAKTGIAALVDGCLLETDGVRYPIGGAIAHQLNATDGFLCNLADMSLLLGIVMAAFAMAVFAMFTILSIREKKQQIGIMRALGASSRDVFSIFFTEGLLIAAISAVLATALTAVTAIAGSVLLRSLFDLRLTLLNFSLRQAGMIFALSLGIATVASIVPILRIARQKPVDAIRKN